MVQLNAAVLAFALGALNALDHAGAVPVEKRAESILTTCNNARLGVISGLNDSTNAIQALLQASNDSAVTSAGSQALTAIHGAQGGLSTIVKGVLAGVTPEDTGVPAIANGLVVAAGALTSINSPDPNVNSNIATILGDLNTTKTVGDVAISQCAKLSTNSSSSSDSSSNSTSSNSTSSGSDISSNQNVVTETVTVTATQASATPIASGAASVQTLGDGSLLRVLGLGRRASKGASNASGSSDSCSSSSAAAVSALDQTVKNAQALAKAAQKDNSTSSAAQTAASALASASKAVPQVQSKNTESSAVATIGQGILDAQNALNTINSTDSSVNSAFSDTQSSMLNVLSTAQHLAIDCTPTAGGVTPGKRRRGLGAMIWG